ncbi:2493_t:CDS:2 [Funneliformis geosporum]|uniref:2493_t:CDS:1 n=1 Tax=Funneliformis geosporum TaxID=1117311 RepID=A0A9W4T4K7_9GLOM|nr:2493_t:CDS:2 [Funneliformis geosporum]
MEDDTLEALSRLSLDLLNFLQTQDYENLLSITDSFPEYYSKENQFDVIVRIDGEDYYCNSDVLISRSSYFRTALSQNYAAKEGSYTIVKESNIPPDTFKTMLRYFYQGDINLNKLDGGLCVNLLRAAEHFRLESFIEDLQRHIIHNKTLWLQHNFIRVVNGVFTMDGDERIRHHLVHKLNDNPWYLLKSDELGALRSSCLISLMEDECFIVNQGIVWDILIRWGIQQSSTLRLDAPNWTYEDWMTLKGAVKDLIPRVKFSGISRNDYYGKILPFNKIISVKESSLEAEEVLICYLNKDIVSPHSKLLRQILLDDSSIINHFHANIILKWINEVIAKIHGSKAIIGGFAPRGLDLGFLTLYTPAIDSSFLFNFKNGDPSMEVENTILCKMRTDREIESEYIPYLWTGPRFGVKDLAIDLHKMKAISVPQYYDNPVHDSKEFNIDDVEVYQIVEY